MATYDNDLRLKEITTGDEDGTWGDSTNTNLELIADGFSYGTKEMAADANETFTMPDFSADATRSLYLKITSAVSLTATREVTLGPNTVSKTWIIENATSGSQIITIKQGSGATVNVPNGSKVMVVTDGAGAGAAVFNANPTEVGGTVTSIDVSGGTTGLTTSGGPVTTSGTITLAGTLAVANGGTGVTSSTGTGSVVLSNSPTFTGTVTIPTADINGGTIDGTVIGGSTAAAGTFTTGQFNTSLNVDGTATMDGLVSVVSSSGATTVSASLYNNGAGANTKTGIDFYAANSKYATIAGGFGAALPEVDILVGSGTQLKAATFSGGGDISFYEDTGTTPKFFWDASAESLGIGTSSPTAVTNYSALTLSGAYGGIIDLNNGSTNDLRILSQSTQSFIGTTSATPLIFRTAATERLRIDSTGNVGIGTTAPVSYQTGPVLNIGDTSDSYTQLNFTTATNGIQYIGFGDATTGTGRYQGLIQFNHANNSMGFGTGASTTANLLIDSSGNVGIGTSSPKSDDGGNKLEISNNANTVVTLTATNDTTPLLNFRSNAVDRLSIQSSSNFGANFLVRSNQDMRFGTNNTERMRIDSSGNLLVGKTSDNNAVAGTTISNSGIVKATRTDWSLLLNRLTTDGDIALFQKDGTTVGSIGTSTTSSNIFFTGASGEAGIELSGSAWLPLDNGTRSDGGIDLGASTVRHRDLYLSGVIYADSDALINSVTVGRGNSGVSTNTAVGVDALLNNTTGSFNTATGTNALKENTTGGCNTASGFQALYYNTTGCSNTASGRNALVFNTSGASNTANGYQALLLNTTGSNNTANGTGALFCNTTASFNTATGTCALYENTTGAQNTANGYQALRDNTTGCYNTATGLAALRSNTTASNNTANGFQALEANTTGSDNTANGYQALLSNTTGIRNTANGRSALSLNTTGSCNTANGYSALILNTTGASNTANGYFALYCNTEGNNNTANGQQALVLNTTGCNNTANGFQALHANTTGSNNTANGMCALYANTTASNNVATGFAALLNNTTGASNTANGFAALFSNTTGTQNTANGVCALYTNTTGNFNTANGHLALRLNTTGCFNTATGLTTLRDNTTGYSNVANGVSALVLNTTGILNTATGTCALYSNTTGGQNTATGQQALLSNTTGCRNTATGVSALFNNTTGDNNIGIGVNAGRTGGTPAGIVNITTEDNRIVMGNDDHTCAQIKIAWTATSDCRDKTEFKDIPHGLDFVRALKPTEYQFKTTRDSETADGKKRYGFLAQDILPLEGDNPVIISADDADKLQYTEAHLIPVLVKAIQELSAEVEKLKNA
jgi:trimeric autotransporter adhesin